jgi:hypothetical protein
MRWLSRPDLALGLRGLPCLGFGPAQWGGLLGQGKIPFSGTLTQTIGDGTADFSMPPVRRGRGQGLGHTGGAWNSIWSPVEEESHPTWLITAAQLWLEGGAAEGGRCQRGARGGDGARGCIGMDRDGPERPVRGEVLTEVDSDDIGALQGVAWRPIAQ